MRLIENGLEMNRKAVQLSGYRKGKVGVETEKSGHERKKAREDLDRKAKGCYNPDEQVHNFRWQ